MAEVSLRILLIHPGPPLSQHDVWRGWGKALRRLGHQVVPFRTDKLLLKYCLWPPEDEAIATAQAAMVRSQTLTREVRTMQLLLRLLTLRVLSLPAPLDFCLSSTRLTLRLLKLSQSR